jgi:hypothetical protein
MPLHDLLTDSQADACPWVFGPVMQSLKHLEYALIVLGRDANAVVAD